MGIGSLTVLAAFIFLVIDRHPWYDARYLLPLGGMIIGNSMTACALVAERFTSEVVGKRQLIETSLSLGASSKEASLTAFRTAYRAALVPTIASMTGMGIVHLPGMMTGQIISGVEPLLAVRYQIAIITAILAAAAISALLTLYLLRGRLFTKCHQISREI
jgi:putative ABC transport system permease protein